MVGMCPLALKPPFQTVGSLAKFKLLFEELLCKYTHSLVRMLEQSRRRQKFEPPTLEYLKKL